MRKTGLLFVFILLAALCNGQGLSTLRSVYVSVRRDTVALDTLSISSSTFRLTLPDGSSIDTSAFLLDPVHSLLIWKKSAPSYRQISTDSVKANYRVYSFLFSKEYRRKSTDLINKVASANPFVYNPGSSEPELFRIQGLTRNGSISRGITFGNAQDVFVNSSLNLQLAGKLNDNLEILAAITDENIPVQPDGNTQQLQEFDKVFIQISDKHNKLIAGDFELKKPEGYFMNYYKKAQGAGFTSEIGLDKNKPDSSTHILRIGAGLAVSKGKQARQTIKVSEGNQGPYRLYGNNGESFIIILAGTERIYFDGQLLTRGMQNDYIIDYNTAEVTFTTRRLITKDSRITAEFEYSDKNYARSLIVANTEYQSPRLNLRLNVYSEQDSKSQPLTLELDSTRKAIMASVGDSIQNAFYPSYDSVAFNSTTVLYQKKDTITASGTYSIFIYSTNADSAYWQVHFSEVGNNQGDYIAQNSTANGRVFQWVEPVGGVPQGNYAPVSLLITPKKQQMVTAGADYKINQRNTVSVEGALSNNDVNLFSKIDKSNDAGYAAKFIYKNETPLSSDTLKGWKLTSVVNYEFTGRDFKAIDRYRNVEFERDWNLGTTSIYNDENLGMFQTTLSKSALGSFTYSLKTYNKGAAFKGLMHGESVRLNAGKYSFNSDASFLNTSGLVQNTEFFRHMNEIARTFGKLKAGIKENSEDNRYRSKSSDTLQLTSYSFNEFSGYINTIDSSKSHASLTYKKRIDRLPSSNLFVKSTEADEISLATDFSSNMNNTVRTVTTYRELRVSDTTKTTLEPSKTLLNRIDHYVNLFKGVLTATTYYEIGTGQERKQTYYYLQVPAGQGVYAYLGDLNGNGVKDLDEFAPAAFQSEAEYLRVFLPTNEYITTRSNQFSEVLTITPAGKQSSSAEKTKFIHRWSDQLSVRLDKKTQGESLISSLNPFGLEVADTALLSANSSLRNTIYFNRMSPVYGFDFTIQQLRNKNFLSSGFETRVVNSRTLNVRWNAGRSFLLNALYENMDKSSSAQYFSTHDYSLFSNAVEPKVTYQPGNSFRVALSYRYSDKRNSIGESEHAFINKFNLEAKYTTVNSGSITGKVSYIKVIYNAGDSNYLAYEMLEGFKAGENFTWNISMQRNIGTYMQLSLNYDGRKLQDSGVVHTGGVQFRAFF